MANVINLLTTAANSLIELDDLGCYLFKAPDSTVHPFSENVKLQLPKLQFARRMLSFEVFGKEEPINILYFFPPQQAQNQENETDNQHPFFRDCQIAYETTPTANEINQIFLTRCCHLIHSESREKLPKNCPKCAQVLLSEQPFILNRQHFTRLPYQEPIEQVISLDDAPICGQFIPENVITYLCPLSMKIINKNKEGEFHSFVATPCGKAFDRDTFLAARLKNDLKCPHCNEEHDLDMESIFRRHVKTIFNLRFLKLSKIREVNKKDIELQLNSLTDEDEKKELLTAVIQAFPLTITEHTFNLRRIFDENLSEEDLDNINEDFPDEVTSLSELLLAPCCNKILHKNDWLNWKELKKEENSHNIMCPACRDPIDLRSKKERFTDIGRKWLNRVKVIGMVAIALIGVVGIFVLLSYQVTLLQSFFPYAASGFNWEALSSGAIISNGSGFIKEVFFLSIKPLSSIIHMI